MEKTFADRASSRGQMFASGQDAKAQCPVTGKFLPYKMLRQRWDGQWVSPEGLDPKHPQERIRTAVDPVALHHPRPENAIHDVDLLIQGKATRRLYLWARSPVIEVS